MLMYQNNGVGVFLINGGKAVVVVDSEQSRRLTYHVGFLGKWDQAREKCDEWARDNQKQEQN